MFAIVKIGNKQFKVQAGDYIRSPFIKEAKGTMNLPVLAFGEKSNFSMDGTDLKSAQVKVQVLREGLEKKILVFKKKRRKGYRRTRGHRQKYTDLKVLEIQAGGSKSTAPEKKASSKSTKTKTATKKVAK